MSRVNIGSNFDRQPLWKVYLGVPLIYLPLLTTIPFMLIGVWIVRLHLTYIGGMNLRSYWEFVPAWASHRYRFGDQIIYTSGASWYSLRKYRWFWIFNCKLYCPLSVALFRYAAYLVKVVENWWCPFGHAQKTNYKDGAIDMSYWHLYEAERRRLHPDDLRNPIWNEEAGEGPPRPTSAQQDV